MAAFSSTIHVSSQVPITAGEVVVTVPGLLAGRQSMRRLDGRLQEVGYRTQHWHYRSLRGSMVHHAARLSEDLCELAESSQVCRIHLVTHSMGSVIARAAIHKSGLERRWAAKAGRIVMMAPPNGGSRLTRIPLGPFASSFPQLCELSEAPDSYVRQLPSLQHMSVGVIAAERDFVVTVEATHLPGQRDHAVLPTTHQRLISHPEAIEMSMRFLKSEHFARNSTTTSVRYSTRQCRIDRAAA
ncbi:esterase/lipase family protein [Allorhodopirellula heiligendammensis]|uniref:Alpha/beta hydrolase family protein n=1 Tax=Allorhodopirellula heiligendammensis TaxID=2714739 RepID=A0A5C6BH30_9BACT|nr:alpha/beta hydrolase [Allorhodopirellula heiligendammensis]TWU10579.1 Alpha/beta hydrolase family protein [Allorhodopirellula heiligendammensis]